MFILKDIGIELKVKKFVKINYVYYFNLDICCVYNL